RRLGERGELHVPAPSAVQLDAAAPPRTLALVHRQRGRGGPGHARRAGHAVLGRAAPGVDRGPGETSPPGRRGPPVSGRGSAERSGQAPAAAAPGGPWRGLHLRGWRDTAVLATALLAFASGFGQFGAVSAL